MGVYKVLKSFMADNVQCAVGQFIEAPDDWASVRMGSELEEGDMGKFLKKIPSKAVPEGVSVQKVEPLFSSPPTTTASKAVARTKPIRGEIKPVEPGNR